MLYIYIYIYITNTSKDDNIKVKYYAKLGLKVTEKQKDLPFIYSLPKIHQLSVGCHFLVPYI